MKRKADSEKFIGNPGGIAWALDLVPNELKDNYAEGLRCGNGVDELNGKPTGIIRVSLGAMSNMKDVRVLITFLGLFVETYHGSQAISDSIKIEEEVLKGTLPQAKGELTVSCRPPMMVHVHDQSSPLDAASVLKCPVAACKIFLCSEKDLLEHFQVHQVCGTRSRPIFLARSTAYVGLLLALTALALSSYFF